MDVGVQVCHSGKDSLGRCLQAGQSYFLIQPGRATQVVVMQEDESTGDLCFVATSNGTRSMFRVEECAPSSLFARLDSGLPDDLLIEAFDGLLRESQAARQVLASVEALLCDRLGCEVADGSHAADLVMAAVRDGVGSAYDLAQLVPGGGGQR